MRVNILEKNTEKEDIIKRCKVCNVAMVDSDGMPYVLPFNFTYNEGVLYLHSAPEGKKIDILNQNPNICVSFSTDHAMHHQNEEVACSYSMRYRSVLIYGKVHFIEDIKQKEDVLNKMMAHYTKREKFKYSMPALKNVKIFKVDIERMDGRTFGY